MYQARLIGLLLFCILPAAASGFPVHENSDPWYDESLRLFTKHGYFSSHQPFRPAEYATRAELVELIVNMQGGAEKTDTDGFHDIPPSHPYHRFFEHAAEQGWLMGAGNCYGTRTCFAHPDNPINRAEAAALIMRAFQKSGIENAPHFPDNPEGNWFTKYIRNAASICILQGDDPTDNVRPASNVNRAEMIVMLHRIFADRSYPACDGTLTNVRIPQAVAMSISPNTSNDDEIVLSEALEGPYGVYVTDHDLFIMDAVAGIVRRYDHNLQPKASLSTPEMEFPHALAIDDNDKILIADHRAGSIFVFTEDGTYQGQWHEGAFRGPVHVLNDPQGTLWVTDYTGNAIFTVAPGRKPVQWGMQHTFEKPHMIAVDDDGNVYVAEVAHHRIRKFQRDGTLVGWTGAREAGGITRGWATTGMAAASDAHGGFNSPTAVHLASDMLYIADTENNRIEIFGVNGTYVDSIVGTFKSPFHAYVYGGRIYVADTGNKQVRIIPLP